MAWLLGLPLVLVAGGPASAATGVRVVLQTWSPLTPDQQGVQTLVDHPSLVSDVVDQAWVSERENICTEIKGQLGVGGVAAGQTLSDITCLLDENPMLEITGGGDNALVATLQVHGYIEATSTTPTVLGAYADPRFSVALSARLKLVLAIQSDPRHTLRVSDARFSLSDAQLDSHNVPADLIEFVVDDLVPFFGGPNFKHIAENAINAASPSRRLVDRFDAGLTPLNAQLEGPSDAVRVGLMASEDRINVAFALRELDPPRDGSLRGTIGWNGAEFQPRQGCGSFDAHATVQTGPVPMFRANAEAPRREIGTFQSNPAGASACGFTLSGLAAGWPTVVRARVVDGSAVKTGSALYSVSFGLHGQGWDGINVVPRASTDNRDYRVERSLGATAVEPGDYSSLRAVVKSRTDPRINPADRYSSRAQPHSMAVIAGKSRQAVRIRPGGAVSLNPQPLPPGPDPDRRLEAKSRSTQSARGSAGTDAGIIIVSGSNKDAVSSASQHDPLRASVPVIAAGTSQPASTRSAMTVDVDALAARGAILAGQDALAGELRGRQTTAGQRGFDIGMGAADGQTLPGPGKQRVHDALPKEQQAGYAAAVAYSLSRNNQVISDYAPRGMQLANQDPLALELRDSQPTAAARTGFDIGMAAAEGQTAPGPGKQRVHDALPLDQQEGFEWAVTFTLQRNRHADLAAAGAAVARADPQLRAHRDEVASALVRLGYDIGVGLFAAPSLGGQGRTPDAPEAISVRDGLGPAARRGFAAAAAACAEGRQ